jgi:hypothetical protein
VTPSATILVPTHNHASTLGLAVGSALAQSVRDIELLIIGDGVTADVRAVAEQLVRSDERVRFFDHPKGENHGETYRDTAIRAAASDAIFYLCDDDLLMRRHVAELLELLETHNFVQSKNGYFTVDGQILPYPGDLAEADTIARTLRDDIVFNAVSVTGTAHSREFYLGGEPWTTTPPGEYPDHHQWRKMMRRPEFSGATSTRMTALQFPSSSEGRDSWTPEQRVAEIAEWAPLAGTDEGQSRVDELVASGDRVTLVRFLAELTESRLFRRRRGQIMADNLTTYLRRLPGMSGSRRR